MKTLKAMGLGAALALSAGLGCGGGQTVPLQPSHAVPAAMGEVHAKKTDQGNTLVDVEVSYLAPPQNVAPGSHVYIVWAQPEDGSSPQNIGALTVGEDRKGKLETLTPLDKFKVLVTPEPDRNAKQPTNDPVMKADVAP